MPTAPRRTPSYDDQGTQVLPVGTATAGPPTAPPPATPVRGVDTREPRGSRPWPRILAAGVVLLVAIGVAFAIGMHGGSEDDDATGSPSSSAGPTKEASSPNTSADEPTEAGMVDFVRTYIATASSDPESAFAMLTPAFQDQSRGLSG